MLNTCSADSRTTQLGGLLSGCWTDADHPDNTISGTNSAEAQCKQRPQLRWRASAYQNRWGRNWTSATDAKRPMSVKGLYIILDGSAIVTSEAWGNATITGGSTAFPTATVIIMG